MTKIVIIGAGSTSFGPTTVATLLREPKLRGSVLALVDKNETNLATVMAVAEKMNGAWGAEMSLQATTERKEALRDADFVVVSIEVPPREKLWRLDWEVTLKHGLRQPYGENGGPGGLMHACRQIPPFMEIVRDMERLCPDAWLINFSNPLPRITRAVTRYSRIKTVGKCHQIAVGYAMVGVLLRERFGLTIPAGFNCHSDPANIERKQAVADAARQYVAIKSAGLNHFIWLLDVRDRQTGEDLYPALRAALPQVPGSLDLLSMELFRIFGYLPIAGDTHLVEYLPWLHDATTRPWEQYQIPLYDWGGNEARREALYRMLIEMAAGKRPVDELKDVRSEGAAELITAVARDENYYDETVNIPNRGAIGNLPDEAVVEVPGLVSGWGVRGVQVGDLPRPIAALCRREVDLVEMVVETAVTGDRSLALQTLLLDPMINDIGRARAILDDYLRTFADVLPQF